MAVKAIPRPELLASFISELGKCHGYNLAVASKQAGKQSSAGIIPQDMWDVLWIAIGTPSMRSRLLVGKLQGIFYTVAPVVSERPRYVSVAVVISLQRQLQLVHILWAGASGFLQAVRIILDSHLDGVVCILNGIGTVGVPGVVWALTALHGISSPAAGFLHHDRLYHGNIFGDSVLVGVFLDDCRIGKDFLAECFVAL